MAPIIADVSFSSPYFPGSELYFSASFCSLTSRISPPHFMMNESVNLFLCNFGYHSVAMSVGLGSSQGDVFPRQLIRPSVSVITALELPQESRGAAKTPIQLYSLVCSLKYVFIIELLQILSYSILSKIQTIFYMTAPLLYECTIAI